MNITENICTACSTRNELHAIVCAHCGAALEDPFTDLAYRKTAELQTLVTEDIQEWLTGESKELAVPDTGIAFYVDGHSMPAYIDSSAEFVLGRQAGAAPETLLDLAPFGGYSLGLSRRHALIQQTEGGYQIMDLGSVNGTWLENERLVPHKAYPLLSGSHLRLARMRLFVLYQPFVGAK